MLLWPREIFDQRRKHVKMQKFNLSTIWADASLYNLGQNILYNFMK